MNHHERLADQFSNMAMMYTLRETDQRLLAAFDADEHKVVGYCAALLESLIDDVCEFIPAANA